MTSKANQQTGQSGQEEKKASQKQSATGFQNDPKLDREAGKKEQKCEPGAKRPREKLAEVDASLAAFGLAALVLRETSR